MITFRQKLIKNYTNARGWRTNRKLLLIESDDRGAVRMPSRKDYEYFLSKGFSVDKSYFDKNDSLETTEDLEKLYDVLHSFKDIKGNSAVITAYFVVANPNFDIISNNGKSKYIYELITETYKRNVQTLNSFKAIKEGILNKILIPQFHGREHINVSRWMEAINTNSIKEQLAFERHAIISSSYIKDEEKYPLNIFSAFDKTQNNDQEMHKDIIVDGLNHFESLFGFKSISFMAPTGIWDDYINETLYRNGVKLQPGRQSKVVNEHKFKFIQKWWGKRNDVGQLIWRRNCTFEPSRSQNFDWVNSCLQEIEIAFRWGKPAVINSHRVNFIGSIFPENREQSLEKLGTLLQRVQKRWPDIEFISTHDLFHIMDKK